MEIQINVDAAIPGAPDGILGWFIQSKLTAYVEPSRAGTPKGEPIGLSRKKFHAVLLAMTNIDLRKQAKVIRTSYGLLRKWRTEDAFYEKLQEMELEFLNQYYVPHCHNALTIILGQRANMLNLKIGERIDVSALEGSNAMPGFGDIGLYSQVLSGLMRCKMTDAAELFYQQKGSADAVIDLSLPLVYYHRTLPPEIAAKAQRKFAYLLSELQEWVRVAFYEKDKDECISLMALICLLIRETLRRD